MKKVVVLSIVLLTMISFSMNLIAESKAKRLKNINSFLFETSKWLKKYNVGLGSSDCVIRSLIDRANKKIETEGSCVEFEGSYEEFSKAVIAGKNPKFFFIKQETGLDLDVYGKPYAYVANIVTVLTNGNTIKIHPWSSPINWPFNNLGNHIEKIIPENIPTCLDISLNKGSTLIASERINCFEGTMSSSVINSKPAFFDRGVLYGHYLKIHINQTSIIDRTSGLYPVENISITRVNSKIPPSYFKKDT